jgi:hypothetical protein
MAVGIDYVGYKKYFTELYQNIQIHMLGVTLLYYQQHDKRIELAKVHAKKQETKKKRAMNKLAIINSAWAKEVEDKKKGHTYQLRMAAPTTMTAAGQRRCGRGDY